VRLAGLVFFLTRRLILTDCYVAAVGSGHEEGRVALGSPPFFAVRFLEGYFP
jgi:hypothetical protein